MSSIVESFSVSSVAEIRPVLRLPLALVWVPSIMVTSE